MMRLWLALSVLLTLAACGGTIGGLEGEKNDFTNDPAKDILQGLRARAQQGQTPLPQLTPQLIDAIPVPTLEIVIENRAQTAILPLFSQRGDSLPGRIQVWRSADGAQVVTRSGVIIRTRGLGFDLNQTDARLAVNAVAGGKARQGARRQVTLQNDHSPIAYDLNCEVRNLGSATVEIVERLFPAKHLRESCRSATGTEAQFDYWVDERDKIVVQSRQWLGPDLGYVRTRRLKK